MNKKFMFSIIIPTYNPGRFLPVLLDSIAHNECADQIEVIISDDCSTESFDETLEIYRSKLNIRVISNAEHAGFPRNGRQHGADEAKGRWFCFADQDDYFPDNTFDKLKKYIEAKNAKNYIISDFIEQSVETGEKTVRNKSKGWTHGKFYEKTFWDKYQLAYDDVRYCEDINLTCKTECVMEAEKLKPYEYNQVTYVWLRRNNSLADVKYFKDSMLDYMNGTLGVIINFIERFKDDKAMYDNYIVKFLATFLHPFFYCQNPILFDDKQSTLRTVQTIQPIYTRFKEITGFTNQDVYGFFCGQLIDTYQLTRNEDYAQVPFVEQMTLRTWLEMYFD